MVGHTEKMVKTSGNSQDHIIVYSSHGRDLPASAEATNYL